MVLVRPSGSKQLGLWNCNQKLDHLDDEDHLVEQAVLPGHLCRDVGQVKVDVEGGQVPNQAAVGTVPVLWDLFFWIIFNSFYL